MLLRLLCLALLTAPIASAQGFIENRGQWHPDVLFLAQAPGHTTWLTRDGFVADLRSFEVPAVREVAEAASAMVRRRGHVVRVRVEGAVPGGSPEARAALPGRRHFFVGESPVTGVRAFAEVEVPTGQGGSVLYTLGSGGLRATVRGGAALLVEGAPLADVSGGAVRVLTQGERRPLAEVVFEGSGTPREAAIQGSALVAGGPWAEPAAPPRSTGGDAVIWSSFLGDAGSDFADEVAVDDDGRAVIAGFTSSVAFPTTPGAYDETYNFQADAFVARFTPDGDALDYATVLGGSSIDIGYGVATNAAGQVAVVGETISPDFPRTGGVAASDESTAFAARFSPDGSALDYAYLIGGDAQDQPLAAAMDPDGNVLFAGTTFSANFPTTPGAYDRTFGGGSDAFVVGLGELAVEFSTLLGGFDAETADALSLTFGDRVLVAGTTASPDFPVSPGAYSTTLGGLGDAYVAWLSTDGATLDRATFIGGGFPEVVWSVANDRDGNVAVGGMTLSTDFPYTPGSVDTTYNEGFGDGFVAHLSADASTLLYGAFLGGGDLDVVHGVGFDADGRILATGATRSADFPAPMGAFSAFDDAFAVRIAPAGFYFDGGTFLSASDVDEARGLAIAPDGRVLVAGATRSADYLTTTGAFDRSHGGSSDVFVTALTLPVLVSREGQPTAEAEVSAPMPNPASRSARLRVSPGTPALVRVAVFDALGRRVARLPEAPRAAGPHEVEVPLAGLAPGVYAVRVVLRSASGEERTVSRRLVVAR